MACWFSFAYPKRGKSIICCVILSAAVLVRRHFHYGWELAEFDIDAIVTALNAAALDPEQWDRALELVAGKSKSFGAIVFPQRGMLPYLPATKSMGDCFDVFVRD